LVVKVSTIFTLLLDYLPIFENFFVGIEGREGGMSYNKEPIQPQSSIVKFKYKMQIKI